MKKSHLNKKKVFVSLIVIIILFSIFFVVRINQKKNFQMFLKYNLKIVIDYKVDNKIKNILIDTSIDGENAKISSNITNTESYIIKNKLYTLVGDTYKVCDIRKSYLDTYKVFNTFDKMKKLKREGELEYYNVNLSAKQTNELLESLSFGKKVTDDQNATVIVKDKKIHSFNLKMEGIEGYENINISIKVEELDSKYNVDTTKVFAPINGKKYKYEKTEENVFEIIN